MTRPYDDTKVGRNWGAGQGVVGHTEPVERETERNEAIRHAEADDSADETERADRGRIPASRSELGKA